MVSRQELIQALDFRVNILVRERSLSNLMTLQQSIGLEAVEAESQAQAMMSENAPPEEV
jgi:hypothetical protein